MFLNHNFKIPALVEERTIRQLQMALPNVTQDVDIEKIIEKDDEQWENLLSEKPFVEMSVDVTNVQNSIQNLSKKLPEKKKKAEDTVASVNI